MIKAKLFICTAVWQKMETEPTLLPPYFQPLTLSTDKNEVSEKVPGPTTVRVCQGRVVGACMKEVSSSRDLLKTFAWNLNK